MEDKDYEENDNNPMEQGNEIHRKRIVNVVNETIEKLELVFCLESLLANEGRKIQDCHLTESEIIDIINMYSEIDKCGTFSSSRSLSSAKSKQKTTLSTADVQLGIQCSFMVAMLHRNKDVMSKVQEILRRKSSRFKEFLKLMYELRDGMSKQLEISATEEQNVNKQIGKVWMNNEKYKKMIADMTVIRNKKLQELSIILNEKYAIIDYYNKKIELSNKKCEQDVNYLITKSEHEMYDLSMVDDQIQLILSEEMKRITNEYETVLSSHLRAEKEIRVKISKTETVLSQWLAKYDQDVGQLYMELDGLTEGYNKEKAEFEDLQKRLAIQQIRYDELMKEKAEEEQRIFDKKRYEFMKKRSARIIQRWWRVIYVNLKKKKRKKKKGKGKKKKK